MDLFPIETSSRLCTEPRQVSAADVCCRFPYGEEECSSRKKDRPLESMDVLPVIRDKYGYWVRDGISRTIYTGSEAMNIELMSNEYYVNNTH